MSGIKSTNTTVLVLVIFILAVLGLYLDKYSMLPGKVKQSVFRFMVGQETRMQTGHWDEMQTEHYVIKYLPVDQAYVAMVAQTAEGAYSSVTDQMGQVPGQQTTIVIYPDSTSLAASFGWDKNEKALGVYWGGTIRILSPGAWMSNPSQEDVFNKEGPMVHEFTHLMVDDMTKGNYNRWWTEGVAQYTEKNITGFEFAVPFNGKQQFQYYTLENLDKNFDKLDQSIAYWEALQAVDFIADNYGGDKIFTIMQCLSRGDSMTRAIENALGIDYNTFSQDFYQYLDQQIGEV